MIFFAPLLVLVPLARAQDQCLSTVDCFSLKCPLYLHAECMEGVCGCDVHASARGHTPDDEPVTYNCRRWGPAMWHRDKREYCCVEQGLGCDKWYNCNSDVESSWTNKKKDWCCDKYERGCPSSWDTKSVYAGLVAWGYDLDGSVEEGDAAIHIACEDKFPGSRGASAFQIMQGIDNLPAFELMMSPKTVFPVCGDMGCERICIPAASSATTTGGLPLPSAPPSRDPRYATRNPFQSYGSYYSAAPVSVAPLSTGQVMAGATMGSRHPGFIGPAPATYYGSQPATYYSPQPATVTPYTPYTSKQPVALPTTVMPFNPYAPMRRQARSYVWPSEIDDFKLGCTDAAEPAAICVVDK